MGKEYDDNDDFSIYDTDLETMAQNRRMRKKGGKNTARKKSFANTYAADMEEETIKIKSERAKRSFDEESFSEKYGNDFDEDKKDYLDDDFEDDDFEDDDFEDDDFEDDELEDGEFEDEDISDEDTSDDDLEDNGDENGEAVAAPVTESAANAAAAADKSNMKKKKKPMSLKRKFFTILASILGIYAVLLVAFILINYAGGGDPSTPPTPANVIKTVAEKTGEVVVGKVPDRTVVLMMVIDKEYDDKGEYQYPRTDSLVLANYDNVNKRLSMMSIPRDTIVEVSDEMFAKMRSEFPEPGKKQMKINAIYHYGGK